jgi:hypothetical protein
MKLLVTLTAVAALGLAACDAREVSNSDSPAEQPEGAGLPNAARIVCDANGTRVEPATVKPQRDGIRLQVVNEVKGPLRVNVGHQVHGAQQGLGAPRGTSKDVLDVPPGSIWLGCRGPLANPVAQPAKLEVVDDDDVWLEGTGTVRDCATGVGGVYDYMPDTRGSSTPAEAVRAQFADAFEPGDALEQLGYPEASTATLSLVRDGVSVRSFSVSDYGDGWLVETDSRCG